MSKKLIALLFAACLVLSIIYYHLPKRVETKKQPRRTTNKRIAWAKELPDAQQQKKTSQKPRVNTNYFTFPKLDKIKSQKQLEEFLDIFLTSSFRKQLSIDELKKNITDDIQEVRAIVQNLQSGSSAKNLEQISEKEYLAKNSQQQWLSVTYQQGFWKSLKIDNIYSWLIEYKRHSIIEITLAKQNTPTKNPADVINYYTLGESLAQKAIQVKQQPDFLQTEQLTLQIAKSIMVFAEQYYLQEDLMIKQNLGCYYRELVYLWEQIQQIYIERCVQNAINTPEKREMFINKIIAVSPTPAQYEYVAFLYHPQNPQKVLEWIDKIQSIDIAWGHFLSARFYAKQNPQKALEFLEKAFQAGFSDSDRVVQSDKEPWLSLHSNQVFLDLIGRYTGKY